MSILEWAKVAGEVGAVGVLAIVVYCFVTGKIVSEHSVKKILEAQANHMNDLKTSFTDLKNDIGTKLDKAVEILGDIRDGNRGK